MALLRTTRAAAGAEIAGLGTFRPVRGLANHEIGLEDDWALVRTGIATRGAAGAQESIVDMAVAGAEKALAEAGQAAEQIDAVLLATCSAPSPMPPLAATVASRIGAVRPAALDVNAACSGFCVGLALADSLVRSGSAGTVLLVGAERMRDWVDPADPSISMIFGDGAGAAVVRAADRPGIGPVVWGSQGESADLIRIPDFGRTIVMRGGEVFRWAITALAPVAQQACERAGISPADLAAFVPHQANLRIVETLARQLGVPPGAVAKDVVDAGNTSAASVPLGLARLRAEGGLPSGSPVLLLGFGAGLTYAAQVVICP